MKKILILIVLLFSLFLTGCDFRNTVEPRENSITLS